jgi:hypothetical protein
MRVLEIHFAQDVPTGPGGTRSTPRRLVTAADGHVMEWLPDEQVLVIDGWRYSPVGARWRVEQLALPTDDTSMFKTLDEAVFAEVKQEPDGTDQPGRSARKARGNKRSPKG